jgi:hypothetical protein
MVVSRINSSIEYPESRKIDEEDIDKESAIYEITAFNRNIVIALGQPKYKKNVQYYPIYIITLDGKIEGQIGVYEISMNDALNIRDEDDDIDIEKLDGKELFYSHAEKLIHRNKTTALNYIDKWTKQPTVENRGETDEEEEEEDEEEDDEEDEEEDEGKRGVDIFSIGDTNTDIYDRKKKVDKSAKDGYTEDCIFTMNETIKPPDILPEETKTQADEIIEGYKDNVSNPWIQKYMKNVNYRIHEVEKNGDCFFAVIRDAFHQMGHMTTVSTLRSILATEITDDIFMQMRRVYIELSDEIKNNENKMTHIKENMKMIKRRIKTLESSSNNKNDINDLIKTAEKLNKDYVIISRYQQTAQNLLNETVGDIKTMDTFEKYREYIQTSNYWADVWAISTLERVLNIKIIILSERSFQEGEIERVVDCGEIDKKIQERNVFNPDFYIMTTHSGDHYRLISYLDKKILKFNEIPYHLKIMILNKCIEKNSGLFYLIQDFRNLKTQRGIRSDIDTGKKGEMEDDDPNEELYDNDETLIFYSKSETKSKPGKGKGDIIPSTHWKDFIKLSGLKEWRRKLDDSYMVPLTIDGKKYASVEHYYQSSKFKKGFPTFSQLFVLDESNDENKNNISSSIILARIAGAKKREKHDGVFLRPKDVVIDPDFNVRKQEERMIALRSKFSDNNPDLRSVLLATRRAKLVRYIQNKPAEMDIDLMVIRKEIYDEEVKK